MELNKTSIIVVGAGPVGLILAHILGQRGVPTVLIDSAASLSDEPRAVALDAESLRTLQSLDLLASLESEFLSGLSGEYLNGSGELLFTVEGGNADAMGFPAVTGINQPGLVKKLAADLARYPEVTLVYQHTLIDVEQSDDGILATIETEKGASITVSADYLVGCDGGRSSVRSLIGVRMEGESNPRPWLVIDTREDKYDGLRKYRFFCDPKRPGMFMQTPHNNRRWEWMILPGEDRDSFLKDENIHKLISPHVDLSKVDIYRRRVYDFHAIIADKFQKGRIFIAGDAAHMTPPFAGQGLNSGIRDVANLGWKLAAVSQSSAPIGLLDSYEQERWQHAKKLIEMAVTLGNEIQPTNFEAAEARDKKFSDLNTRPADLGAFVGSIFQPVWDRFFLKGCAVDVGSEYFVGRLMPQPVVTTMDGHRKPLDKLLGLGLAIVGYNCDPARELGHDLSKFWREQGAELIGIGDVGTAAEFLLDRNSGLAQIFPNGDGSMILLRPDRFCMASFNRSDAAQTLQRAGELLGYY